MGCVSRIGCWHWWAGFDARQVHVQVPIHFDMNFNIISAIYAKPPKHNSMDEAALATVCEEVAKPMKKVVRKTFEEAVFLVSLHS